MAIIAVHLTFFRIALKRLVKASVTDLVSTETGLDFADITIRMYIISDIQDLLLITVLDVFVILREYFLYLLW